MKKQSDDQFLLDKRTLINHALTEHAVFENFSELLDKIIDTISSEKVTSIKPSLNTNALTLKDLKIARQVARELSNVCFDDIVRNAVSLANDFEVSCSS